MNNSEKQSRESTTKTLINFFAAGVMSLIIQVFLFWGNFRARMQCYPIDKITKGVFSNSGKMFSIIIKVISIVA